jgi:hypothetical protein
MNRTRGLSDETGRICSRRLLSPTSSDARLLGQRNDFKLFHLSLLGEQRNFRYASKLSDNQGYSENLNV